MRRCLNRMHDLGLIRIAGWKKEPMPGPARAVWAFGKAEDAPYPAGFTKPDRRTVGPLGRRRNLIPELTAFSYAIKAMASPVTRAEIVAASGASHQTLAALIRHGRAIGLLRVAAWDTDTVGRPIEALQIGSQPDAPKPKRLTKQEVNKRFWAASKAKRQAAELMRALTARQPEMEAA